MVHQDFIIEIRMSKKYLILILTVVMFCCKQKNKQIIIVDNSNNVLAKIFEEEIINFNSIENEIKLSNKAVKKLNNMNYDLLSECRLVLKEKEERIKISIFLENQSITKYCPYIEFNSLNGFFTRKKNVIKININKHSRKDFPCNTDITEIKRFFE